MNNKTNVSIELGGPAFLLFLVFLVLKLCKVITWSWWWVTAPLWIPLGLAIIFIVIAIAGVGGCVYFFMKARESGDMAAFADAEKKRRQRP